MRDFQKIDWKIYNRPPFYQQWLCRDDTLKLASFGDKGLSEVDDQILSLKDQWNLDDVKGHFLDRIGKLLNEYRNGNTDNYYRILLKLRRLLNTNDGSIPSIIKAIKFFYSSEIVHIVPDYPAGLIIEHDGEGTPGLNFNKLLAEIIPAGVSFSTKELFYFTEELPSGEKAGKMKSALSMMDSMAYIFRNGVYRRNGEITRRYNGVKDLLAITIEYALRDQLFGRATRSGLFRRDGTITHNDFANDVATELWSFNGRMDYAENAQSSEQAAVSLSYQLSEGLEHDFRRNGKSRRNGTYNRTQNVVDVQKINVHVAPFTDTLGNCGETFTIRYRKHYYHNGRFRRNGAVKHDSNIPLPLEE
jgi:hypothetical protein